MPAVDQADQRGRSRRLPSAGVGPDGRLLRGLRADLVGGRDGAGREEEQRGHAVGQRHRPLECPHPAHRATSTQAQRAIPRASGQRRLDPHLVAHGHLGETRAPPPSSRAKDDGPVVPWQPPRTLTRRRTGRCPAAPRARSTRPPTGRGVSGPAGADDVAVTGESCSTGPRSSRRPQRAPRLVRHPDPRQRSAARSSRNAGRSRKSRSPTGFP